MKFLNGESAAVPAGLDGGFGAAFDLVFILACVESLDFLTGDFILAPGFAASAFGRAGVPALPALGPAGVLLFGAAGALDPVDASARDFAAVLFTADLRAFALPAVDLAAGFFAGVFFAVAFFAAGAFLGADALRVAAFFAAADFPAAAAFFAAGVLLAALVAASFAGRFRPSACFAAVFIVVFSEVGFFAAAFRGVVTVPLFAALLAVLARGLLEAFSVIVAAMMCLAFLACDRARELLTPGNSKGA